MKKIGFMLLFEILAQTEYILESSVLSNRGDCVLTEWNLSLEVKTLVSLNC